MNEFVASIKENNRRFNEAIDATCTSSNSQALIICNNEICELELWFDTLTIRKEVYLYKMATKDFFSSIVSVCSGQYRQAFFSLRYFLEHYLFGVYLSAREMELNIWLRGKRDIYWSEVTDPDKGIFSNNMSLAFFPELAEYNPQFQILSKKLYREISEFVHGNPEKSNLIPSSYQFDQVLFENWIEKAQNIVYVVKYATALRYMTEDTHSDVLKFNELLADGFKEFDPIERLISERSSR